jgi:hypothetical protein
MPGPIRIHHVSSGPANTVGTPVMRRQDANAFYASAFFNLNIILSERRLPHFLPLSARHAAVHHSPTQSTHMSTITRTIRAETEDGQLIDIPPSAWADVVKVAKEEFDAFVNIHVHPEAGAYHDGPDIPFPHFLIEATLDPSQMSAFIERIDPIINDVVASHTQLPLLATK